MEIKEAVIVIVAYIAFRAVKNICDAFVAVKYFHEKNSESVLCPLPKIKNNKYIESEPNPRNNSKVQLKDIPIYDMNEIRQDE